jgi:hypothetical protein
MPSYNYNQYDTNRESHAAWQNILKKASLAFYDVTKFLIDFIGSMIKMFLGK